MTDHETNPGSALFQLRHEMGRALDLLSQVEIDPTVIENPEWRARVRAILAYNGIPAADRSSSEDP